MRVTDSIRNLVPYQPGKPIEEARREYGLDRIVKLASNENPLGCSPKVKSALIKAIEDVYRYPDAAFFELRQLASRHYQLPPENVTFGNGSEDLIDVLIRVFCDSGESILTSKGAFIAYSIRARAHRARVTEVAMTDDFHFDLKALRAAWTPEHKLIFISNPNNPTGTYLPHDEIRDFIKSFSDKDEVLIVLDEAYFEYYRAQNAPKSQELLREFPQKVVLLRTFAKAYGLAGLRLGMMLADASVITYIDRVRNPFNINVLAQVAGIEALRDQEFMRKSIEQTWTELDKIESAFKKYKVPFCPSQANFVFFEVPSEGPVVFEQMLREGVILRPLKNYGFAKHLRISVGLSDEVDFALEKLFRILKIDGHK